ncbi:MAG: von Willebrand factor type A domain-containing protein [Myxococcota bacterium]
MLAVPALGTLAAAAAMLVCTGSVVFTTRSEPVSTVSYETPRPVTLSAPMDVDADNAEVMAEPASGDGFVDPGVHGWVDAARDGLSTFSVDVDRGSYAFARRQLREGRLPDPRGVRTEEFVNALAYDYPEPEGAPFSVHVEASPAPRGDELLVRIGLQGRHVTERRPVHLVFLVDTSGSMSGPDRLGLVKEALRLLVGELGADDTVAIVTYAGSSGVALPPTSAGDPRAILAALDGLESGGSTAMGAGIELAYRLAGQTLASGSTSRVILASDGDANVGATSLDALLELIRAQADRGVTLTTLGFGEGNFQDFRMEQLADRGDGNYFYVDGLEEARHVFVDELASTLEVIARDVKVQVAWNAEAVQRYRLVGYENRAIADDDFRDDRVDAGEIGAGHTVTALYEVVPQPGAVGPLATVRLRSEPPGAQGEATERAYEVPRAAVQPSFAAASPDHRMAVAVALFAERLRASPHAEGWSYAALADLVAGAMRPGHPEDAEVLELVRRAGALDPG